MSPVYRRPQKALIKTNKIFQTDEKQTEKIQGLFWGGRMQFFLRVLIITELQLRKQMKIKFTHVFANVLPLFFFFLNNGEFFMAAFSNLPNWNFCTKNLSQSEASNIRCQCQCFWLLVLLVVQLISCMQSTWTGCWQGYCVLMSLSNTTRDRSTFMKTTLSSVAIIKIKSLVTLSAYNTILLRIFISI